MTIAHRPFASNCIVQNAHNLEWRLLNSPISSNVNWYPPLQMSIAPKAPYFEWVLLHSNTSNYTSTDAHYFENPLPQRPVSSNIHFSKVPLLQWYITSNVNCSRGSLLRMFVTQEACYFKYPLFRGLILLMSINPRPVCLTICFTCTCMYKQIMHCLLNTTNINTIKLCRVERIRILHLEGAMGGRSTWHSKNLI